MIHGVLAYPAMSLIPSDDSTITPTAQATTNVPDVSSAFTTDQLAGPNFGVDSDLSGADNEWWTTHMADCDLEPRSELLMTGNDWYATSDLVGWNFQSATYRR